MTGIAAHRPASGARYILERAEGSGQGELVYRGLVCLPEADIPIEVRLSEATGATKAIVDAGAVPDGGLRIADLERIAAALVKSATRAASAGERLPPRKIVRWRG